MEKPVSVCDAPKIFHKQSGQALMILLILLATGVATLYVHTTNSNKLRIKQDQKTNTALAQAKDALIGYAAKHPTLPGALPCPDTNNDGSADVSSSNCNKYIGRLPWKQLGLSNPRDGSGECLWYALSPVFRNALPASSRTPASFPLNSNTAGQITLYGNTGSVLSTPPNPVIAVIFAPGPALPGQDRSPSGNSSCGGNTSPSAYLDNAFGIDNATGNGTASTFIAAPLGATFNDRLLYITSTQLFSAIEKRVAAEIRGLDTPATSGLQLYYQTYGSYPWANNPTMGMPGQQAINTLSGHVPNSDLSFTTDTITWLENNDWFGITAYTVTSDQSRANIKVGNISPTICMVNGLTPCP